MDPLFNTVEYALGGLQLRLDTVADNLANSQTPLFRSKTVNFEKNLRSALANGKPAPDMDGTINGGFDLPDVSGNSVSMENELTEMTKSSLERQVMVSGFNYKLDLMKAAAGVMR